MQGSIQQLRNPNTVFSPVPTNSVLLDSQRQERGSSAAKPEAATVPASSPASPTLTSSRHNTSAGSTSPGEEIVSGATGTSQGGSQNGASNGPGFAAAPLAASASVAGPAAAAGDKEKKRAGVRALLAEVATLRQERQLMASELEELRSFNARLARENCR